MKLFGKRAHLRESDHQLLFFALVSEGCMRQRYAGAFLASFSQDLAAKQPEVLAAGYEAHRRRHGDVPLNAEEIEQIAMTLLTLVAVEKFGEISPMTLPFAPDALKAIWMIIFSFSEIAATVDPQIAATVKSCIESVLGDWKAYFVSPTEVAAAMEWGEHCDRALGQWHGGNVDSDEFAEIVGELLHERPPIVFS